MYKSDTYSALIARMFHHPRMPCSRLHTNHIYWQRLEKLPSTPFPALPVPVVRGRKMRTRREMGSARERSLPADMKREGLFRREKEVFGRLKFVGIAFLKDFFCCAYRVKY